MTADPVELVGTTFSELDSLPRLQVDVADR